MTETALETLLQASVDLAELRKWNAALKEENARKDRHITLLNARIRILEARLSRRLEIPAYADEQLPALLRKQCGPLR